MKMSSIVGAPDDLGGSVINKKDDAGFLAQVGRECPPRCHGGRGRGARDTASCSHYYRGDCRRQHFQRACCSALERGQFVP